MRVIGSSAARRTRSSQLGIVAVFLAIAVGGWATLRMGLLQAWVLRSLLWPTDCELYTPEPESGNLM